MSLIRDLKQALSKAVSKKVQESTGNFNSFTGHIPEVPVIIEKKQYEWIYFGEDNLYPNYLSELPYGSAIHNAIIKTKAKMNAGDGILLNGTKTPEDSKLEYEKLTSKIKIDYDFFIENKNGGIGVNDLISKLAYDFQLFGAFSYEVVYNIDFTKIVTLKYVPVKNVRIGKTKDKYFISTNWKDKKVNPIEIYKFDITDKEHMNQLVYEKAGGLEFYGEPSYIGGINWIRVDYQMGIFHLSSIENGMNPSLWLKFYKLPASENDRDSIMDDIKSQFKGAKNAGKHMVTFSDGKDLAPDFEPIDVNNLDKQLLLLAELCDKKILTAHQLTSPLIVGISVSGQLGGNTELQVAFKIFDNTIIESDRKKIESSLNTILKFNQTPVTIEISQFDPFKEKTVVKSDGGVVDAINSLSPLVANKVLESMTADEIRNIVGLDPAIKPTTPIING